METFGLQLSTITPLMMADFEGTLASVAEIGYKQIEFSAMGLLGRPVEHVQKLLNDLNLEAPVGRVTPKLPADIATMPRNKARAIFGERARAEFMVENVRHALDETLALEQKYLNLPALMPADFQSLDQVKRNIEYMNQAGELCAAQGVRFGYHNHNWEFIPLDGVVPYDLMLAETAADKVSYQFDVYWVVKGAGQFSAYLSAHPGRFLSCHLKDMDANGDFEDVGYGTIDIPAFVREAKAAGALHFFVERDGPSDPSGSIRRSYDYVSQMTY